MWDGIDASWKKREIYQQPHPPPPPPSTKNDPQGNVHGKGNSTLPYRPPSPQKEPHQSPQRAKKKKCLEYNNTVHHTRHTYRANSHHPLTSNTWNRHAHTQHTTSLPAVPPTYLPHLRLQTDQTSIQYGTPAHARRFFHLAQGRGRVFCAAGGGRGMVVVQMRGGYRSEGGWDVDGWLGYSLCMGGGHGDDGMEVFSPPPAPGRYCYTGSVVP